LLFLNLAVNLCFTSCSELVSLELRGESSNLGKDLL
jgi:hypothetical protein